MKQHQSNLVQILPHKLTGTEVPVNFGNYLKSFISQRWTAASAYISLLKPLSATLNALSALMGVLLAVSFGISWGTAAILFAAVWLAAAGSGAVNSYLDRDIDKVMQRTARRPLSFGIIEPAEKALYVGTFLIAIGVVIPAVWLNLLSALFVALGAAIYIFIYTLWLKRRTPWSVVVGGLAGSCALLAGWFSVSASFSLLPLIFGIFIFLWTPGHFWGLAIRGKDDSVRANIPTLPTVYGERAAAKWTALSNLILIPLAIVPYFLGLLGIAYLLIALVAGTILLVVNIKLYFTPTAQKAWTVFKISSPYLAVIYLALAIDILIL